MILIIAGVIGLVLIGAAVYFYMIKPSTENPEDESGKLVCYYVDPAVIMGVWRFRKGFFKQHTKKECISGQEEKQQALAN